MTELRRQLIQRFWPLLLLVILCSLVLRIDGRSSRSGELQAQVAAAIHRGNEHRDHGRYDAAIAEYDWARRAALEAGEGGNAATAINNLGLIEERRGDLERAVDRFEQARQLYRKYAPAFEITAMINLARVEMRLDQLPQAGRVLEEARKLSDRLQKPSWRVDREIGWWHHLSGRPQDGIEPLRRAASHLGVDFGAGPPLNVPDRAAAGVLDRLGRVLAAAGSPVAARQAFSAALTFFEEAGRIADTAHTRTNLCRLLSTEEPSVARALCRAALSDLEGLGETTAEAQVLFELARLERREKQLDPALESIQKALTLLESVRFKIASRTLQGSFLRGRQEFDDLHLGILMDLHTRDPGIGWNGRALEESERARGRILLEMLAEAEVNLQHGISAALRREIEQVEAEIARTYHRREAAASHQPAHDKAIAETDVDLRRLVRKYHAMEGAIRRQDPAYAELMYPEPIRLKQIRDLLDPETTVLAYWLGEEQSFVWVFNQAGLTSYTLPARKQIERLAKRWYELVSEDLKAGYLLRRRDRAAERLAECIFAPVADQLVSKRLAIVSDGALQLIPLGALPDLSTSEQHLLIESYEIVRLPSLATLASLRRRQTQPTPKPTHFLALISDPVFSADDERLGAARAPGASGLPRLKETSAEAQAILELVGNRPRRHLEGLEVRRQDVLEALQSSEVAHLATHAIIEAEQPLLSRVALTQVDDQGRPTPHDLRALDLYSLKSSPQLVVLSSCRTLQELRGEGLVGLTRGFMYAGTTRLLVSLWYVEDEATALLMQRFYRNLLKRRLSPSQALRQAQLAMVREGRSPYHWAAFTLHGDWRPIATLHSS